MEKRAISAEIIADSINEHGVRLTTFVLTFPRIVLAEFNTHRVFSRNSASSRAIPFKKMVKMIQEDPFIPLGFQKDHKGMQGTQYFDKEAKQYCEHMWLQARDRAVMSAMELSEYGVTKQLCNRILEPFAWHTVIVTASEWENFFALRAHEAAEIHIQKLAHVMLDTYNDSSPNILANGEWHIPFGDKMDDAQICEMFIPDIGEDEVPFSFVESCRIKIATARCARVSYMNFDGTDDYEKDIALHDRLADMGHWSPFEHCAQVISRETLQPHYTQSTTITGNFGEGWKQYRKTFENENQTDHRVK